MILKFNSRINPGQDPGYKLEVSIHFYLKNKNQNNFVLIINKKIQQVFNSCFISSRMGNGLNQVFNLD